MDKVIIRAKSTLKLSTEGSNHTWEFPKGVPMSEVMRIAIHAEFINKGAESCRANVEELINRFEQIDD